MPNGIPRKPDDLVDRILKYVTAWLIIGGILVWMYQSLVNPDTAVIPEGIAGIVFGGFISILTIVVTSLYQGAATRDAGRQMNNATEAAVAAALATPPSTTTVSAGPPVTVTTSTQPPLAPDEPGPVEEDI